MKLAKKRGKPVICMYKTMYKSVNINFFSVFTILSKFQELSCVKVK